MVTLFVSDLQQTTFLEQGLILKNIKYDIQLSDGRYGLDTPYLLVDGVPLDEKRAWKWLEDQHLYNFHK